MCFACIYCVHTHIGMSVGTTYRMRFNFCRVYISQICNFCDFRVIKFVVAGSSSVDVFVGEIFMDIIWSESVYHNSIRQLQRCKTCWTRFSAAYLAILAFWVSVMVLSYWALFIDPMATLLSCSRACSALHIFPYSLHH